MLSRGCLAPLLAVCLLGIPVNGGGAEFLSYIGRPPADNDHDHFALNIHRGVRVHAACDVMPDPRAPYNVTGTLDFVQSVTSLNYPLGLLEVRVQLRGFPTHDRVIDHGVHVHQYGDTSKGCEAAGSHYDPLQSVHGAKGSPVRHVGDFGNVREDRQGGVSTEFKDKVASLVGDTSIMGRAIVIHEGPDDLGLGGSPSSMKNGNSGAPVACCVIAFVPGGRWQGIQNLGIL